MIGYIVPRTAVRLHIPGDLGGAARRLYRVDRTWVFDRGLSRVRDAGGFVYVTRSPVTSPLVLGPSGVVSSEHVGGRSVPVCRAPGLRPASSPFAVSARTYVGCFSPATSPADQPAAVTFWSFPLLIAAIDPAAEARLVGLDKAVVSGRYLRPGDTVSSVSRGGGPGLAIPVLSPTRPYVDEQLRMTVWRLPAAAARAVLHAPLTVASAQRRFGAMGGMLVRRAEITAAVAYRQLLAQSHSPSTSNSGMVDSIWKPGPGRLHTCARRFAAAADGDQLAVDLGQPALPERLPARPPGLRRCAVPQADRAPVHRPDRPTIRDDPGHRG